MTSVLVTGATGFLGRHLCARLHRLGWQVSGLGRNETVGAELEREGIRFIRADLQDADRVKQACAGQRYVFHCGALSSPWGQYRNFYESNVEGTRNVVAGCREFAVRRLVHVSTPSLYFDFTHREQIRESDPLPPRPVNAYAATKLMAEEEVKRAFDTGVAGVILRPRAIFGPMDTALFPRLLQANSQRGVPMIGGGQIRLDLTYVDNVVDAMLLACEAPERALGSAYNITNGEPVVLREVLTQLFGLLGISLRERRVPYAAAYGAAGLLELAHRVMPKLGEPLLTRYSVGVMARTQTLDISEARERLGYVPRVTMREGLESFAAWWRNDNAK